MGNFDLSDLICPKSVCLVSNRTNEHLHRIKYIWTNLSTNFCLFTICLLGTVPKSVFPIKNKTNEYYHQIQLIQISFNLLTFTLNRQFWYFEPIFPKKSNSSPKTRQINIFIEFSIFGLVWALSLILNRQCWLF